MRKITVNNYRKDKYYPRVTSAVSRILARKDFVAPIDLFTEMGLLSESDLQKWRRGQIPYLERVINCNLAKASRILRILRFHAHDLNLGPSMTEYKHRSHRLRFSKSGEQPLETAYSRHFMVLGKPNQKERPTAQDSPGNPRPDAKP